MTEQYEHIASARAAWAEETGGTEGCSCFACVYGKALLDVAEAAQEVLNGLHLNHYGAVTMTTPMTALVAAFAALNEVSKGA